MEIGLKIPHERKKIVYHKECENLRMKVISECCKQGRWVSSLVDNAFWATTFSQSSKYIFLLMSIECEQSIRLLDLQPFFTILVMVR